MAKKRPVKKKKVRYSNNTLYQTAGDDFGATTTVRSKDGTVTVYKSI